MARVLEDSTDIAVVWPFGAFERRPLLEAARALLRIRAIMSQPLRFDGAAIAPQARRGYELFARAGFAAQGVLYATIGALAGLAAFGAGGRTTDSKGALRELGRQPFGKALLIATAVGLAGYALFLLVQALRDPDREAGSGFTGAARRVGWFFIGLIHGGLVLYAVRLVGGTAAADRGTRGLTAQLLAWEPFGVWVVAGLGVIVAGAGAREMLKGWREEIDPRLGLTRLRVETRRVVIAISRFGMMARGVVFVLVGAFFVMAAAKHNPSEARGLGEVLAVVHGAPYGAALLGVVAAGLVAFAAYDLVRARYRVIEAP